MNTNDIISGLFIKKIKLNKAESFNDRLFERGETVYEIAIINNIRMEPVGLTYLNENEVTQLLNQGSIIIGLHLNANGRIVTEKK